MRHSLSSPKHIDLMSIMAVSSIWDTSRVASFLIRERTTNLGCRILKATYPKAKSSLHGMPLVHLLNASVHHRLVCSIDALSLLLLALKLSGCRKVRWYWAQPMEERTTSILPRTYRAYGSAQDLSSTVRGRLTGSTLCTSPTRRTTSPRTSSRAAST